MVNLNHVRKPRLNPAAPHAESLIVRSCMTIPNTRDLRSRLYTRLHKLEDDACSGWGYARMCCVSASHTPSAPLWAYSADAHRACMNYVGQWATRYSGSKPGRMYKGLIPQRRERVQLCSKNMSSTSRTWHATSSFLFFASAHSNASWRV